jgi:pyrimidine-nucleoside phosphorylase
MDMYDILTKKKHAEVLSKEEIEYFVNGFTKGEIPDYQASALLMAICINHMNDEETAQLTDAMMRSGEMLDLSVIPGTKVDKHSTGGVGRQNIAGTDPNVGGLRHDGGKNVGQRPRAHGWHH